jgi:hypothetical protein
VVAGERAAAEDMNGHSMFFERFEKQ